MILRTALVLGVLAGPAAAGSIESAYTSIDDKEACALVGLGAEGEGDWAETVCTGFRGFPVIISYGDARESVFYGFPPDTDDRFANWESFGSFNSVGPKIEWRYERDGERVLPFATIHRWFVSEPEDSTKSTQVLVVEKVGTLPERQGCVVGYVVATGDPRANEKAREIADGQVRGFVCGSDEPVVIADGAPLPPPYSASGGE